jgi:uncharacterized repeat protein (TIGR03803 family)
LHVFTGGKDGAGSFTGLTFDRSGNLYGTTSAGGSSFCDLGSFFGCGVIFRLIHTRSGWDQQVLYSFTGGLDGATPSGRVVFDWSGSLYGTATEGGDPACGCGTVFRLSSAITPGSQWSQRVLYTFTGGSDGAFPAASVIFDTAGNLYSTAYAGGEGSCGSGEACGTIFQLAPGGGGAWSFNLLYSFSGTSDGGSPRVILGVAPRTLYGATDLGGYFGGSCGTSLGCGTVFEITATSRVD